IGRLELIRAGLQGEIRQQPVIAGHVAQSGHAAQHQRAKMILVVRDIRLGPGEVHVRIDQTGNCEAPSQVVHLRVFRIGLAAAAIHVGDSIAIDRDRHVLLRWRATAVDHGDVRQQQRRGRGGKCQHGEQAEQQHQSFHAIAPAKAASILERGRRLLLRASDRKLHGFGTNAMHQPKPHIFLRCLALLLIGSSFPATRLAVAAAAPPPVRIVAYTTDWNSGEDPQLGKIDTLIFAFARVSGDQAVLSSTAAEKLDRIVALEAAHPDLKVVISVGGWGAGGFSEMAATAGGRQAFADGAARMVTTHHADGIDIDWEYPGHHESGIRSSPQDRANFTLLMTALRGALDRAGASDGKHYTLSAAVADGPFVSGVDIAAVAPLVDWFNLMTYDFCNSMTPDTCHHTGLHPSALAPADARSTDRAVRQFLSAGAPARKLLIGVAMYGREFDQVDPAHDGLYQPYGHYEG